jgi:hypothetical protein
MNKIKHAIVKGIVFRAHDRTTIIANEVSEHAQEVMNRTLSVIDDCR